MNSSDTPLEAIRSLYDSGMSPDVAARVVADGFVLDATPGFPLSGQYSGWDNVVTSFFGALGERVSLTPVVEALYAQENHVLAVGHYDAETPSGRRADIRFVHDWTFSDSRAIHMRQTADSAMAQNLYSS